MTIIEIDSRKIKGFFFKTSYSEIGKQRLKRFYDYYEYLEGFPVVEKIADESYQLITLYENYEFYSQCRYMETIKFKVNLKSFKNDNERYLEVLKQLCDGKGRFESIDKIKIIQILLGSMAEKEISHSINVPISEITKYTIKEDEYKEYMEKAIKKGYRTTMAAVISFLKKSPFIKEKTRNYILDLVLSNQDGLYRLTKNKWDIAKVILEGIQVKYIQLNQEQQVQLFGEIIRDGWTVLIDYFDSRCNQLLSPSKEPFLLPLTVLINESEINFNIHEVNFTEENNNYLS